MSRAYAYTCTALALALAPAVAPTVAQAQMPAQICQASWIDPARANRAVPVRIRMPAGTGQAPVILFSHGLGGNLDSGTDWVAAWAAAGFITVNIQHAGSDDAVWKGASRSLLTLGRAMNAGQLAARAGDVSFVLDQMAKGGHVGACDLGRADMHAIGMSGHSFGAQTTLAVTGGTYAGASGMQDRRIKAAIAFSPQPSPGEDDHTAFSPITMPFFTVTGTRDAIAAFNGTSAQDRLRPYQAMPQGQKYLLILNGATHLMLNGQTLPRPGMTPTPAMVDTITQATTLFWQATLKGDTQAAARLKAFGQDLAPGDQFSMK